MILGYVDDRTNRPLRFSIRPQNNGLIREVIFAILQRSPPRVRIPARSKDSSTASSELPSATSSWTLRMTAASAGTIRALPPTSKIFARDLLRLSEHRPETSREMSTNVVRKPERKPAHDAAPLHVLISRMRYPRRSWSSANLARCPSSLCLYGLMPLRPCGPSPSSGRPPTRRRCPSERRGSASSHGRRYYATSAFPQ